MRPASDRRDGSTAFFSRAHHFFRRYFSQTLNNIPSLYVFNLHAIFSVISVPINLTSSNNKNVHYILPVLPTLLAFVSAQGPQNKDSMSFDFVKPIRQVKSSKELSFSQYDKL